MTKLVEQWRSIAIGVLIVIVAAAIKFVVSDIISQRVKLENIPAPATIALKSDVQEKFNDLNSKLDKHTQETDQHLDRIEQKIDRLMLTMIAKKSAKVNDFDMESPADAPSVPVPSHKVASKADPSSVR
jgi:hypothetical protein